MSGTPELRATPVMCHEAADVAENLNSEHYLVRFVTQSLSCRGRNLAGTALGACEADLPLRRRLLKGLFEDSESAENMTV